MSNFICTTILGLVAFVAYMQVGKSKAANKAGDARLWMILSIIVGAFAVLNIAVAIGNLIFP